MGYCSISFSGADLIRRAADSPAGSSELLA
jgi:hypothetical protein